MTRGYKKVTELTPEQQLNKRMDDVQHMVSEYSKGLASVMKLINSKVSKEDFDELKDNMEGSIEVTDENLNSSDEKIEELETLVETLTARLDVIAPKPNQALQDAAMRYDHACISISKSVMRIINNKKLLLL